MLRSLILALSNYPCGKVRNSNGGICFIHMLTAGTADAKDVWRLLAESKGEIRTMR
jgi:hypothetical protein